MSDHEPLDINCEILTTDSLVLRPPHADDAADMMRLANNYEVASKLATMPYPYVDEDADKFLTKVMDHKSGACIFAITHATTGEFMGICSLVSSNGVHEYPYIGYWLGEPHWGNGYATECARAMVDLFFKTTNRDVLQITTAKDNPASRRVVEKCGGKFWKDGEIFAVAHNQNRDVEHYRITRADWMGAVAA